MQEIYKMFKCKEEHIIPIRIIDSYAFNNSTTTTPVIDQSENLLGPKYEIRKNK